VSQKDVSGAFDAYWQDESIGEKTTRIGSELIESGRKNCVLLSFLLHDIKKTCFEPGPISKKWMVHKSWARIARNAEVRYFEKN
jgi:hypothetical protein